MQYVPKLTAIVLFAALPTASLAQVAPCGPRDKMIVHLKERYSERLAGGGMQSEELLLEVWASDKSGSFTVLSTQANGISCIVASGQHWAITPAPLGEKS